MNNYISFSPYDPCMQNIFREFGISGYGAACAVVHNAQLNNEYTPDIKTLSFWARVRIDKVSKMNSYLNEILQQVQIIFTSSQDDLKMISTSSSLVTKKHETGNPRGRNKSLLLSGGGSLSLGTKVTNRVSSISSAHFANAHVSDPLFKTSNEPQDLKPLPEPENKASKKLKNTSPDGGFNLFWEMYPRKVAKKKALQAWESGKLEDKAAEIMASIERYKLTESWIKDNGKFIPHASTFLNQERWNDEVSIKPQTTNFRPFQTPTIYKTYGVTNFDA